ncbi:uncharacterized protein LOC106070456 isoform X1 [Biomphalaria glabrata]|uniref:Uncharacterized protein LOC106070456 isoform X1 n=2 Tax=Biomphalaria glabrata TaxID=6526 RepID=A0A9W2YS46_BIOGL|nr:uncharacterized protein LOC106070456 isoform X1 [Biomphalaria glabrata]KAI8745882.1 hypothetical protein BgiMline_019598 [Biomphalaria glabrata]
MFFVWYLAVLLQDILVYKVSDAQNFNVESLLWSDPDCTVGKISREMVYKFSLSFQRNVECKDETNTSGGARPSGQEMKPSTKISLTWWKKICLHSTGNPNTQWTLLFCKNISACNCKDFNKIFFMCDECSKNTPMKKYFRLNIWNRMEYSQKFLRLSYEDSQLCFLSEEYVFQLPRVLGSPLGTLELGSDHGLVLSTVSNCSLIVKPGAQYRLKVCVHNLYKPTIELKVEGQLTVTTQEDCITAAVNFDYLQLPTFMSIKSEDKCDEIKKYYCSIGLEPDVSIYYEDMPITITEESRTCVFHLHRDATNMIHICVKNFPYFYLSIEFESRRVIIALNPFSCLTVTFMKITVLTSLLVTVKDLAFQDVILYTCQYIFC